MRNCFVAIILIEFFFFQNHQEFFASHFPGAFVCMVNHYFTIYEFFTQAVIFTEDDVTLSST